MTWKTPLGLTLALATAAFLTPTSSSSSLGGVRWETSMDSAIRRAKKENKPILLLQLFGRLDDEFC